MEGHAGLLRINLLNSFTLLPCNLVEEVQP